MDVKVGRWVMVGRRHVNMVGKVVPKRYVQVLTYRTCGCDLIWNIEPLLV